MLFDLWHIGYFNSIKLSDGKKFYRVPPHPGGNRKIQKAGSIGGGPVGSSTGPLHALWGQHDPEEWILHSQ